MHIEHWLALGLLQRVSRTHLPLLGKQTCCLSQPSVFASSSSERVAAQQATISNRLLKCEQKSASAHALSARQEKEGRWQRVGKKTASERAVVVSTANVQSAESTERSISAASASADDKPSSVALLRGLFLVRATARA